jgi:4-aminobutyrate aminotransferase-like enzyme
MLAADVVDPAGGRPDPACARRLLDAARAQGLLLGLGGAAGSTLRIAPPMTVTEREIHTAVDLLGAALDTAVDHPSRHAGEPAVAGA